MTTHRDSTDRSGRMLREFYDMTGKRIGVQFLGMADKDDTSNQPRDDGSSCIEDRIRAMAERMRMLAADQDKIADEAVRLRGIEAVASGYPGGDRCSNGTRMNGGSASTRSSSTQVWQRDTDPISVLAVLLRSGAERIETEAPAMRAHAGTMLIAADELIRLHACTEGAFKALEISQRQLETLAEPEE